ncbi:MAG: SDR family NAD(P)-dependent oxidoreductase [Flavobacteriales bacterium]|nr:SDR family NAD(P)-dependent oxidoreductase [Flavobacteriales bacterium]
MSQWNLLGKRALITGGSKGIGAATVAEFTSLGADVRYVERNGSEDPRCMTADISDPDGRQQVIDGVAAEWGGLGHPCEQCRHEHPQDVDRDVRRGIRSCIRNEPARTHGAVPCPVPIPEKRESFSGGEREQRRCSGGRR